MKNLVIINGIQAGSFGDGHSLWVHLCENSSKYGVNPLKKGWKGWKEMDGVFLYHVMKELYVNDYIDSGEIIPFSYSDFERRMTPEEKVVFWNQKYALSGYLDGNDYDKTVIFSLRDDFNDVFDYLSPLELAKLIANSPDFNADKKYFYVAGDKVVSIDSVYDKKSPAILSGVGDHFIQDCLDGLVGDDPQNLVNEFERINGRKPF